MYEFSNISNKVRKNTEAANRMLMMDVILAAELKRTNGLLEQQIVLQEDSLRLQDFSAHVHLQSLSVSEEILEQLNRLGEDMKATADRSRKEMLADQLNAELVKVERAFNNMEESDDLFGLVVATYRIQEHLSESGITAASFTSKADMRDFEEFREKATELLAKYQASIEDIMIYSALMASAEKLKNIIVENRTRLNNLRLEKKRLESLKTSFDGEYKELRLTIRRPLAGVPAVGFSAGIILLIVASELAGLIAPLRDAGLVTSIRNGGLIDAISSGREIVASGDGGLIATAFVLMFSALVTGVVTSLKRGRQYQAVKGRQKERFGIKTKSTVKLEEKHRELVEPLEARLIEINEVLETLPIAIQDDEQRYYEGIAAAKLIAENTRHKELKFPALQNSLPDAG